MNFKTTLFLAVAMGVCALGYFAFRRDGGEKTYDAPTTFGQPASSVEKHLIAEDELGDAVKVTCKLRDKDEAWVFEKAEPPDGGTAQWYVREPFDAKAVGYQVDRIASQLTNLVYEIAYKKEGLSEADAGLAPPVAVITVTDDQSQTRTVEVGKSAGGQQTYVRLAGADEIVIAKTSMATLFKDTAIEYRDQQLLSFNSVDATRLEAIHRVEGKDPVHYVLLREGSGWVFESPFTGRASAEVESAVQQLGRLRISDWVGDDPDRLGVYGLADPALKLRVTVLREAPKADEDEAANDNDDAPPERVEETYEVHVSAQSPIGDENRVYACLAGETAVGLISKTTGDKLAPVETRWRDMKLTAAAIDRAKRIEIETEAGAAALVKEGSQWRFDAAGGPADSEAVTKLINSIKELEARAYVDYASQDAAAFGFDSPRGVIRVSLPGSDEPERFTIGAYSDPDTQRMVYVRRNESTSIAKVRVGSVEPLLRGPDAYRDRIIVRIPGTIEKVTVDRVNRFDEGRQTLVFERMASGWRLTSPSEHEVTDELGKWIEGLEALGSERFVADGADPAEYGLDAPAAVVTVAYMPPPTYKLEKKVKETPADSEAEPDGDSAGDGTNGQEASAGQAENDAEGADDEGDAPPTEMVPVEVPVSQESVELRFAEKDGVYYAMLAGAASVFEVSPAAYENIWAEYVKGGLMDFSDSQVVSFTIRDKDAAYTFNKPEEGVWQLASEPDLPLSRSKVQNLLVQMKDITTSRYVRFAAEDLGSYGLDVGQREYSVTLDDGSRQAVIVSRKTCPQDDDGSYYAVLEGRSDVFLISKETLKRFKVDLAELEESDG